MKKSFLLLVFILGFLLTYAQEKYLPVDKPVKRLSTSNYSSIELNPPFDTLFRYNLPDTMVLTSIETDGNYYYLCAWWDKTFAKYDMDGNFIETFILNAGPGFTDLAWDGEYFYGGRTAGNYLFILDLANEEIIDSINIGFNAKALAYDHDLDVFYANTWDDDVKVFTDDGTILDTIPLNGLYGSYSGFAYDGWTAGGPYLWGFSQEMGGKLLVQMQLPSCHETGLTINMNDYWPDGSYSGGLFTHEDELSSKYILGGVVQNTYFFGLDLIDYIPPPTDSTFAVSYHHGSLVDSFDVQLTWASAKYCLVNEYFDYWQTPPGWEKETYTGDGFGWTGYGIPHYFFWPVPELDSRFIIAYEDIFADERCCDYLITPEIVLNSQYDYYLSFESYYDGSNNHSGYVKYSTDDGSSWELLHTMVPDSGQWVKIKLDLAPLPDDQPLKIAFHSDDNWGFGSGWVLNNVMIYTDDIPVNVMGYDIYRDGEKVNTEIISDTVFVDQGVASGDHEYYISAVYTQVEMNSGNIEFRVPHYPQPPPSPDCNSPENLEAEVINDDIHLNWEEPTMSITKDDAWDVQFVYPLHGEGEAGFTCDGDYFYTTYMYDADLGKYDLQGNYISDVWYFEYSTRNLEYVPLTGETYMTFERYLCSQIIELPSGDWLGNFSTPVGNDLAIAYNPDLDAFYVNDRSSDILLIDRETEQLISSFICGTHGNYYDFAYDNWSAGGPYLWGFSSDGTNGSTLVQISLPSGEETGFTYDASWLSPSGNAVPGGIFIMEDLVPGTVSLCGILQGEVMFGLELGPAEWNFQLGGYNVYMDNSLHNTQLITDTSYLIQDPAPGTYNFEVSAVYVDTIGDFLCESPMEGPASATITGTDVFLVGGNVIAGAYKLDQGDVSIYRMDGSEILDQETTEIDDLGYYLFPDMIQGYYMMHASPSASSEFYSTHIPTYIGDLMHWEDVSAAYIEAHSYNNDIHLIELVPVNEGIGLISGVIYEDGTDSETPLPNVQVMLLNADDECIMIAYTNIYGEYSFENLAFGTYKLLVEIPGKSMTPSAIYLQESNPERTGIDMYVLSDEIVFGIDEAMPEWIHYLSEIYPNPAREEAYMNINLGKTSGLDISIISIAGQVVHREHMVLNKGPNRIKLDLHDHNNGVYFVNIEFEERYTIKKKLLLMQ